MSPHPRWAATTPPPEAWKVPKGPLRDRVAEQDAAAGGRQFRRVNLPGGRSATASIALKHLPKSRRIYGYLRYAVDGKTITKYAGDATAQTRPEALYLAWKNARDKGLLTPD